MTGSITEAKRAGDILRWEQGGNRSREKAVIATSQTLSFGQVVKKTSAGQIAALGTGLADDVQTIGITGTLSAGSFTLGFTTPDDKTIWTDPIAYNGNTAAVQAGVDTALGGSICVVAGTAITAMTFTFSGTAYSGIEQPLIQINTQGLTGEEDTTITHTTVGGQGGGGTATNEVQLMAISGTLTSGTFTVTGRKSDGELVTTGTVAYNGNTAALQAVLDTAFGTNQIIAGGTAITAATFTFSGDEYAGWDVDQFTVDAELCVGKTSTSFTTTTQGGPAGSGDAYGVMLEAVTTTSATAETVIAARECTVDEDEVVYTPGNRRDAMKDLEARGFLFQREGNAIFS